MKTFLFLIVLFLQILKKLYNIFEFTFHQYLVNSFSFNKSNKIHKLAEI